MKSKILTYNRNFGELQSKYVFHIQYKFEKLEIENYHAT